MHGHAAYYVITCNCTCAFLWLLSMSTIVYTVASSSTEVQNVHNHHTALGWIACKHAKGFAQECFIGTVMNKQSFSVQRTDILITSLTTQVPTKNLHICSRPTIAMQLFSLYKSKLALIEIIVIVYVCCIRIYSWLMCIHTI